MFVSMCFKIMSKIVKYACRLRRYQIHRITQDQLNTRHFLGIFLRGGGAKFKFAPGRHIPSLRHCLQFKKRIPKNLYLIFLALSTCHIAYYVFFYKCLLFTLWRMNQINQ